MSGASLRLASRARAGGSLLSWSPSCEASRRCFSADTISHPSSRVQVYQSRSTDPYLNLSIEHFLLQKSHPDSVVLLLYTNRPCVVIGRNQNPWIEVNLGLLEGSRDLLRHYQSLDGAAAAASHGARDEDVQLVRRRSGGGTVFHDAGNINWSIICPPAIFDRDKHAEMVVRALRSLSSGSPNTGDGKLDVRVNERHDIVMDVPAAAPSSLSASSARQTDTFKISGSAYKLTRLRSLHHGTLLLSSPNLPVVGRFLRSPAEPYIKARGVESVRSPIRNVGLPNHPGSAFEQAVIAEFRKMYCNKEFLAAATTTKAGPASSPSSSPPPPPSPLSSQPLNPETISSEHAESLLAAIPAIRKGYDELRSQDWIFAQTPGFTFSTHPTDEDPRPRPDTATQLDIEDSNVPSFSAHLSVRHGQIDEVEISGLPAAEDSASSSSSSAADVEASSSSSSLVGVKLYAVQDWRALLGHEGIGSWFNSLFGVRPPPP